MRYTATDLPFFRCVLGSQNQNLFNLGVGKKVLHDFRFLICCCSCAALIDGLLCQPVDNMGGWCPLRRLICLANALSGETSFKWSLVISSSSNNNNNIIMSIWQQRLIIVKCTQIGELYIKWFIIRWTWDVLLLAQGKGNRYRGGQGVCLSGIIPINCPLNRSCPLVRRSL